MIEEIQAILPLLEKISDGALYAFMIFMFVQIVSVIIWPLSFMFVFKCAPNIIKAMWGIEWNTGTIDFYKLNYKGKDSYLYGGDLEEFLKKEKK